eukprot:CAMPEP_0119467748 /NCGR_PEP_ID=MMETSP1344-20130328/1796_1 /TAXON_ID=236787 /ORGANISM="Florenciella parvula, Strain CCMP2471" /LENGTH=423 /DNA_ID=CAMNT_0007500143 /DNA_START=41 /DNA_END=1312 /DNA_ORIENTATION=-
MAAVPNIVRGEGVYLYDDAGKRYIDWTSQAICSNLGHTIPPQVKAAIDEQLEALPFIYSGLAITEPRARLSALMAELCPGDINGFLFPCGGSEANEAAIRIARRFTGKEKIITHYRSYHGGTTSALAATGDFRRWFTERGGGGGAGYIKAFNPQPFHLEMGATEDEIAAYSIAMLEEQILMEGPNEIAAIMMESICGAAGVLIHPEKYLQGVRALCDKYEILLILDEVMVGFGRTGKFWGFQNYEGVVPDIMTSAKGLSGSFLPLSVVGVKQEIKDHFMTSPLGWGATYQAHPVALACAYESVKHMVKEDVVGHVKKMEPIFLNGIQSLIDEHPSVKQGRGIGLFGCIDTINAEGRLTQPLQGPITERNIEFKKALAENGVYGLLRLPLMHAAPPLIINEEELLDGFDRVHAALEQSLDKDFK